MKQHKIAQHFCTVLPNLFNFCTEFKICWVCCWRGINPVIQTSPRHMLMVCLEHARLSVWQLRPASQRYLFDFMDSGNELFYRNTASNYFQRDSIVSYKKTGWNAHYRICTATVKGNKQQKIIERHLKQKQKSSPQHPLAQYSISTCY